MQFGVPHDETRTADQWADGLRIVLAEDRFDDLSAASVAEDAAGFGQPPTQEGAMVVGYLQAGAVSWGPYGIAGFGSGS